MIVPPAYLLADCPIPEWAGGDWAAIADLAVARGEALAVCNADKRAVRQYVEAAERLYADESEK